MASSNYANDGNTDDGDVEIAVPDVFKLLVRNVVKTFYSKEAYLVVDIIIHRPLIKEDKLVELLHFDRKILRAALNDLRKESLIRVRLKVETDNEGKQTRQNYYSIAYSNFLSVVKYKLDEMRVRIDKEERASIRRTNFQCPTCAKLYSDLEIGHLLDMATGRLLCTFCKSEVSEVTSGDDNKPDARQLMTMFNTQLSSLFELLRECEQARQDMLDAPIQRDQSALAREAYLRNNSIVVKMPNQPVSTEVRVSVLPVGHKGDTAPVKPKREQPIWMTTSVAESQQAPKNPTQDDVEALFGVKLDPVGDFGGTMRSNAMEDDLFGVKPEPWLSEPSPNSKHSSNEDNSDVLHTLLTHEKMETASNASEDFVDVKEEKAEPEDQPAVTADSAMVSVQGKLVPYADVTDDLVRQMTESERQEYIRIGSELYSDLYD